MFWFYLLALFLFFNVSYTKEPDTAFSISKVTVFSYAEIQNDDITPRKVYQKFKVFQGDSLILSVGEFYDKPAEILLVPGKYKFSFYTPKGWKEFEIYVARESCVISLEKLCKEHSENNR